MPFTRRPRASAALPVANKRTQTEGLEPGILIAEFGVPGFCFALDSRVLGRLRTAADFDQVRAQGRRWRGKLCALNAAPQVPPAPQVPRNLPVSSIPAPAIQPALTRVGYITSKKVGKAVQRNRARRLMREAVRHLDDSIVEGWDIVLIAQSRLVTARPKMQDVKDELKWLLGQAKLITPTSAQMNLPANPSPASLSPSTSPRAPSPAKS